MTDRTSPAETRSSLRATFEGLIAPDLISDILPTSEVNTTTAVNALYAPSGNLRDRLSPTRITNGLARRRTTVRGLPAPPAPRLDTHSPADLIDGVAASS